MDLDLSIVLSDAPNAYSHILLELLLLELLLLLVVKKMPTFQIHDK
jgi:uncharacterized membrane protein